MINDKSDISLEPLDLLREEAAKYYDQQIVDLILAGCEGPRATTLRANRLKTNTKELKDELVAQSLNPKEVPWYEDALILPAHSEEAISSLSIFDSGEIYLQNLSAMIPALVLAPETGEDICDLCAAPGGKTAQIASLAGGSCFITAVERSNPRAEKLAFNLQRQGANNVTVLRQDARQLDEFFSFDRVLVDAPCSGSGTLLVSNPKTLKGFTAYLIEKSASLQKQLLTKALSLVRPGGTVVYSTCSILKLENEYVIRSVLEPENHCAGCEDWNVADVLKLRKAKSPGRFKLEPISFPKQETLPILPSQHDEVLTIAPTDVYEGFFVAKFKRIS